MKHIWLKRAAVVAGVIFGANGAMAEAKWTYENNVLTGIVAADGGETAMQLSLTADGVLSLKSAGTQKVIDLSSAAMPEGAPAIRVISNDTFNRNGNITSLKFPETLEVIGNSVFWECRKLVNVEPFVPASVTNIDMYTFGCCTALTNGLEIGFGEGEVKFVANGNVNNAFQSCSLLPYVKFGPGVKELPVIFSDGNIFTGHEGPIEIWFGPNLAKAAAGAMGTSVGGTNAVSFYFQGDMFTSTSSMFSKTTAEKSGYRYRFYVGAEGCTKWQEFLANTEYVTPWAKLGDDVKAEYRKHFSKGRPYGLTTAAAALSDGSGLPEAVWVFSLKPTGMCIRIQ